MDIEMYLCCCNQDKKAVCKRLSVLQSGYASLKCTKLINILNESNNGSSLLLHPVKTHSRETPAGVLLSQSLKSLFHFFLE